MRKSLLASLLILAAALGHGQDAPAPHTKAQIIARWEECRPKFKDWENMERYADLNDPMIIGKPKAAFIQDGLGMFNFIRYLAGLPDDVVADEDLNYKSQALTAINAMNDINSHNPPRPEGMPKDIYDAGFAVGHKCNLQYSVSSGTRFASLSRAEAKIWGDFPLLGMTRRYSLARITLDCVADSDYRNVATIQHRRNFMRPQTGRIGFGYIDVYEEVLMDEDERAAFLDGREVATGDEPFKFYLRRYSSSYVVDSSRERAPDFDYYAWPSRGYMPLQFWQYGHPMYPWSITLNPNKYSTVDPAALSVELADAKGAWKVLLDKDDRLNSMGMIGDMDTDENSLLKPFLYYLPMTASWLPTIHFFPGEGKLPLAAAGDRIRVTIRGLKDRQGKSATLSYWVEFLDLPNAQWILDSDEDY